MTKHKVAIALAAGSMAITPIAVQAVPVARAAAPTVEENGARNRNVLWILLLVAAVVAVVALAGGHKNNKPVSS